MKKLLVAVIILAIPPLVAIRMIRQILRELDHSADNIGDIEEWWNEVFDEYEWDDWYDPA